MEQRTQNDIVSQHLQSLQIGEVLEDRLKIPGVDRVFDLERPKQGTATRSERLRLPLVGKSSVSTREEIALAMVQSLQARADIVGVQWDVGEDFINVTRLPGAKVYFSKGIKEDDVQALLLNILKSRALLRNFSWNFGDAFVKVAYENSQFA